MSAENRRASQSLNQPQQQQPSSTLHSTDAGKLYIMKTLTESSNPWESIAEIQQVLSSNLINYPVSISTSGSLQLHEMKRWQPSVSLLDELNCPRSTMYFFLMEKLKNKLIKLIDQIITSSSSFNNNNSGSINSPLSGTTTSTQKQLINSSQPPELKLIEMLKVCISMITTPELRTVPIYIIKKLTVVPKRYLTLLAKHNYLGVCYVHIMAFILLIFDLLNQYVCFVIFFLCLSRF